MDVSFEPIKNPVFDELVAHCKMTYSEQMSFVHPSKCVLPNQYDKYAERILNFEIREDDVWIVTYPKCGTTWTQEMVWLLVNNLDFETAKKDDIVQRGPFIELSSLSLPMEGKCTDWIEYLDQQPSPRCIKSHLPKELLPLQLWTKKPKIVYVARNPKDVLLSNFHHHQTWYGYDGSLDLFARAFVEDVLIYGPFWEHILDFWAIKEENVLFSTYEDMKKDLPAVIRKTCKFLNKNYSEEQLKELADHLSFEKMKVNPAVNYEKLMQPYRQKHQVKNDHMRKGESGAWKKDLPEEIISLIDTWSRKKLVGSNYLHYD